MERTGSAYFNPRPKPDAAPIARSARTGASALPLHGRQKECAALDQLLVGVRAGTSGVLLLSGEAGIGKTALLDYAAAHAGDLTILRATGVEAEMELGFAALHQLCLPLLESAERLPAPQRDALRTSFGLGSGPTPNRFLLGLAALTLLSEAAESQPLLCLVDDAQWLDRSSAQVLSFVARRLQAESVLMLFAQRDQPEHEDLVDLPELHVEGLSDASARALLSATYAGPLDQSVRDRIIAETHGNPLALLELPHMMSSRDLAGGFAVPGGLHNQLEASFWKQISELPRETQRLLLLAAAEPTGDPALLSRAASELGVPIAAAAPAESASLVEIARRVTFRHPLVRAAIYNAASPEVRRAAHAALASATDPEGDVDRRAWHRAQATWLADEEVAAELEQSAGRASVRGGLAAAAAFLERSAALTPDAQIRARRALAAAELKHDAGLFDAAQRLVAEAEAGHLDELEQARAERLQGRIAFALNRDADGPLLILAASKRLRGLNERLAHEAYVEALEAAVRLGQRNVLLAVAEALPKDWQGHLLCAPELFAAGRALRITGRDSAAAKLEKRGFAAIRTDELGAEDELRALFFAFPAAVVSWDVESARRLSARYVELARDQGALAVLPSALEARAVTLVDDGDFGAARASIAEADAIAAATGAPPLGHLNLLVAAWCDRPESALARIQASILDAERNGWPELIRYAEFVSAILHNGYGQYRAALDAAERARSHRAKPSGTLLSELIEAAVRCDERDRAASVLPMLSERTQVGTDPARALEARAQALLSDGDTADALYRESIERYRRTGWSPALARSHLLYGEWLRREKRRIEAREQLRSAYELFTSIGVCAFAERALRELLATGETVRKRVNETRDDLTPQEAQIARLAADGCTNAEIAAQLFLSRHTVEYHLRKVFLKLDIKSRTKLARTLPAESAAATR